MDSIIRKGVTIIQMPQPPKKVPKQTGVIGTWIADGKYKAEIYYKGKTYHLGTHEKLEDAKRYRETAEATIQDGTFLEWHKETFPPKQNKYGVMGLSYRKDMKKYILYIGYNKKTYNLSVYSSIEDAALVRAEADKHIADGTFEEWYKNRKTKKAGKNK